MIKWYTAIAAVWLWDKLSPRRRLSASHVQKYRDPTTRREGAVGGPMDPEQCREDFSVRLELLRSGKIHPVVAERLPLTEARRAHELLDSSAAKGKLVLIPYGDEGRSTMTHNVRPRLRDGRFTAPSRRSAGAPGDRYELESRKRLSLRVVTATPAVDPEPSIWRDRAGRGNRARGVSGRRTMMQCIVLQQEVR